MKTAKALLILAVGLGLWFAGCDVKDPGSALPNRPPTATLSVAPTAGDTVNHYIPLNWAGNDGDGEIVNFYLIVDGVRLATTMARDTTMPFAAPSDGTPLYHTFGVVAVDNLGLLSDTASTDFYVVNYAPTASFDPEGSIAEGATVGAGFRMSITATDGNPSLLYYRIALDDSLGGWSAWTFTPVFVFASPDIISDPTFPDDVEGISNAGLTAGAHVIYAKAKDAGEAESPMIRRTFTVDPTFRPVMDTVVTAAYGANNYYADGSVYYSAQAGLRTQLTFGASAAAYSGEINAYRFRVGDGSWSAWTDNSVVEETDVPPGVWVVQMMARDLAGVMSDTAEFTIRIVQQTLSDSVIVVDETRNGNGNPGSPNDVQVDQFYDNILTHAGAKFRNIDWDVNAIGGVSYVSPWDIRHAGLIIWHSDDASDVQWDNNQRILREFLDKGGRLILSGWDLFKDVAAADSQTVLQFAAGSFGRDKLRAFEAFRTVPRTTLGFTGVDPFPSMAIDPAKMPASWAGKLAKCWSFQQRGECTVMGRTVVSDSLANPFANRTSCYVYDLSFRVAVFGVPMYFCNETEAASMMDVLLPRMLQGLQ
ncbi:hypothetical protein EHM69_00820 [candidate division KSB1 bacterium]|nr:MAG: hypothetical protein EHM69_00820 [candidate division KSB1 bacterium]